MISESAREALCEVYAADEAVAIAADRLMRRGYDAVLAVRVAFQGADPGERCAPHPEAARRPVCAWGTPGRACPDCRRPRRLHFVHRLCAGCLGRHRRAAGSEAG